MGMDSAVRKFVKEIRDIVAEEVRAKVGGSDSLPPRAEGAMAPRLVPTQDADDHSRTADQRTTEHLAPHAPSDPTQPIFDAAEAAWFLRYSSMKAFYQAVHRYGIPHARRGARVMLFRRADLERFLASRTRSH